MNDIELIHGDCLIEMQKIPDGSVDAVICDLPYGVLNRSNRSAKWDSVIPLNKLWEHYRRIVKESGAIVLFAQGMFTARLMMSNPDMWRYNLIWDKINRPTGFLDANRKPLRIHEDICVFYRSQPTYNPQFTYGNVNHSRGKPGNAIGGGKNGCYGDFKKTETVITNEKYPNSIVRIPKEHRNFLHSTQKPVALVEWLVRTYTNEGELVLDNTAGSMTTAIACLNTGRRCICIEKDDDFFETGKKRVEDYQRQLKMF